MSDNTIADFLSILHQQRSPEEFIELRAYNRAANLNARILFTQSIDEAVLFARDNMAERDVYVGVTPRARKGSGKLGAGTNADVLRSYWAWADFDAKDFGVSGQPLLRRVLTRLVLPPTLVVASGSGGLHMYWAIDPATTDLEALQKANDGISNWFKIAHVGDPARILRVAGTINHKGGADGLKPVAVLHHDSSNTYAFSDVQAMLNVNENIARLVHTGDARDYNNDRSNRDFAVCGSLIAAGFSDDTIKQIYSKRQIGDKTREASDDGEHYLDFTLAKLRSNDNTPIEFAPVLAAAKQGPGGKWGIVEKDCCYYAATSNGGMIQLSTFVFELNVVLEGDGSKKQPDTLLGTVRMADGSEWQHSFSRGAFNKVDAFRKELIRARWQWFGRDSTVHNLLPYLLDQLSAKNAGQIKTRQATPIIGRHGDVFVLPEQTITAQGVIEPDKAQLVFLPTGKEHPPLTARAAEPDDVHETLEDFCDLFFKINEPSVVWAALGFFCASLLKPVLETQNVRMPTLNLFGTRGSGKTTLVRLLQGLVGYDQPRDYDANTTPFVILALLGSTNAVPISLSEYRRASLRDPEKLLRFILIAYDSGHDSRGRSDQTTVDYPLVAPFVITGEDAISDAACLERTIQINLQPEAIAENTPAFAAFKQLATIDLRTLALPLIQHSLSYTPDFDDALKAVQEAFPMVLPDRVRRNVATILVGMRLFANFAWTNGVELPDLDLEAVFKPILENVVNLGSGRTYLMVDDFVTDVVNFLAINEGQDQFVYSYEPTTRILNLHLTSAYSWWLIKRHQQHQPVLDRAAIKVQLRERMVAPNAIPQGGKYVLARETMQIKGRSTHMYRISLTAAVQTPLDIPETLNIFRLSVPSVGIQVGGTVTNDTTAGDDD